MAKKYQIVMSTNSGQGVDALEMALIDYYGSSSVNIYYKSLANRQLVFKVSSVCSKVIKVCLHPTAASAYVKIGDLWNSGISVVNEMEGPYPRHASNIQESNAWLVLDEQFIAFLFLIPTSTTSNSQICIIGTLDNGRSVAVGFGNNTSYGRCYALKPEPVEDCQLFPMTMTKNIVRPDGTTMLQPFMFCESLNLEISAGGALPVFDKIKAAPWHEFLNTNNYLVVPGTTGFTYANSPFNPIHGVVFMLNQTEGGND